MSTEDRLTRLGLLHLKDKPEELRRALEEGIAKDKDEQALAEARRAQAVREARARIPLAELEARLHTYDVAIAEGKAKGQQPSPHFTATYDEIVAEIARRRASSSDPSGSR